MKLTLSGEVVPVALETLDQSTYKSFPTRHVPCNNSTGYLCPRIFRSEVQFFLQEEKLAKMGSLKTLLFLASWSLDVKVVNIEGST